MVRMGSSVQIRSRALHTLTLAFLIFKFHIVACAFSFNGIYLFSDCYECHNLSAAFLYFRMAVAIIIFLPANEAI